MALAVIDSLDDLRARWPDLRDAVVVGLDLRSEPLDWPLVEADGAVVLGTELPPGIEQLLADRGAGVITGFGRVPFRVHRATLYTYEELTAPVDVDSDGARPTLDDAIGSWFRAASPTSQWDTMVRAVHDATVEAAVARFVTGRRMVGVMGGHALARGAPLYRRVAELGRSLTRAGFCVATGGGPGVMEAANLGAWCAPFADTVLDDALSVLDGAPAYEGDGDAYVRAALEVRRRWPRGGESLAVPTWVYLEEPTGAFASHIAKYFTNSIREDGLLAIARSGVVYAPGGAGTVQEIFTDAAQNSLTLYEVRSPMVFFDRAFFEDAQPELVAGVRRQAATFGWSELVAVCEEADQVQAILEAHDPDAAGTAGVERRRRHGAA